jgi:hypothetical protein
MKNTKEEFFKEMDRLNEHMHQEDVEMQRISDHCLALDQYLDKY